MGDKRQTLDDWVKDEAERLKRFNQEIDMTPELPKGAQKKDDRWYNASGELIEVFEGRWRIVKDTGRSGWWRFNEHYDRQGYCDNPARGY